MNSLLWHTPTKHAHGCVVLCFFGLYYEFFVVVYGLFTHIPRGYCTRTGATIRLPHCQWSNPKMYGLIISAGTNPQQNPTKRKAYAFTGMWIDNCRVADLHAIWPFMLHIHYWCIMWLELLIKIVLCTQISIQMYFKCISVKVNSCMPIIIHTEFLSMRANEDM